MAEPSTGKLTCDSPARDLEVTGTERAFSIASQTPHAEAEQIGDPGTSFIDTRGTASMLRVPATSQDARWAPIAQLDRALVYGTRCRKFESSWARHHDAFAGARARPREPERRRDRRRMDARSSRRSRWCRSLGEVPVGCVIVVDADGPRSATGQTSARPMTTRRLTPRSSRSAQLRRALGSGGSRDHALRDARALPHVRRRAGERTHRARRLGLRRSEGGRVRTLFTIGQDPRSITASR